MRSFNTSDQTSYKPTLEKRSAGGGLFAFRLDQRVKEILARKGKQPKNKDSAEVGKILLRVFCHAYGNKIVLLLGGYDKGKRPSASQQQSQIGVARNRLKAWRGRQSPKRRK